MKAYRDPIITCLHRSGTLGKLQYSEYRKANVKFDLNSPTATQDLAYSQNNVPLKAIN